LKAKSILKKVTPASVQILEPREILWSVYFWKLNPLYLKANLPARLKISLSRPLLYKEFRPRAGIASASGNECSRYIAAGPSQAPEISLVPEIQLVFAAVDSHFSRNEPMIPNWEALVANCLKLRDMLEISLHQQKSSAAQK